MKENIDIYIECFERFLMPCGKWTTKPKDVWNMFSSREFYIQQSEKVRVDFADQKFVIACLAAGKLPKYFNKHERSPAHIAAVVLNPQLKCKVTQESKEVVKRKAEKTLSRLWKNEYRSNTGFLQRVTPT